MKTLLLFILFAIFLSCNRIQTPKQSSVDAILTNVNNPDTLKREMMCGTQWESFEALSVTPKVSLTSTGVIIGNVKHTLRIKIIDKTTLLEMPQFKVENEDLFIPNAFVTDNRHE